MILLLSLLACQSAPKESVPDSSAGTTTDSQTTQTNDSQDSTRDTQETGTNTRQLVGQPPANPVPLPDFVATNYDEAPRSRDDLLGHRTIIWFYPAASTAG